MITSAELKRLLESGNLTLIDVRLADDHLFEHIPGSIHNCVFEVAFGSRLGEQIPDRATAVCVYGANESSHESRMAAEKLQRAGYEQVFDLREGLAGWKSAGFETVRSTAPPFESSVEDGVYLIDLAESRVEWWGRNLINKHWGSIGLKSGEIQISDGLLSKGEFILDMNDIHCYDLAETEMHDVLIHHLQSDDFFDVERYPEARLSIESSERIADPGKGQPNLRLHGHLTLRGETHPISMDAAAGVTTEGKPAAQAAFSIDRTRWNVIYGSGKFFKRLAGHLVNDLIELQVRVLTK